MKGDCPNRTDPEIKGSLTHSRTRDNRVAPCILHITGCVSRRAKRYSRRPCAIKQSSPASRSPALRALQGDSAPGFLVACGFSEGRLAVQRFSAKEAVRHGAHGKGENLSQLNPNFSIPHLVRVRLPNSVHRQNAGPAFPRSLTAESRGRRFGKLLTGVAADPVDIIAINIFYADRHRPMVPE